MTVGDLRSLLATLPVTGADDLLIVLEWEGVHMPLCLCDIEVSASHLTIDAEGINHDNL